MKNPFDGPSDLARQTLELRRLRGLTQAELSRLTGIAKSDISRFECGRSAPTTRTMDRIARALGARMVLEPDDGQSGDSDASNERLT
jgi:transcriptional regulator with XRE-family HTH domain